MKSLIDPKDGQLQEQAATMSEENPGEGSVSDVDDGGEPPVYSQQS